MHDSQTSAKKDDVDVEENGPAEDRRESGYYYDDSTGYEVYEDEADDESSKEDHPKPNS
jgi:hypothetical protein